MNPTVQAVGESGNMKSPNGRKKQDAARSEALLIIIITPAHANYHTPPTRPEPALYRALFAARMERRIIFLTN